MGEFNELDERQKKLSIVSSGFLTCQELRSKASSGCSCLPFGSIPCVSSSSPSGSTRHAFVPQRHTTCKFVFLNELDLYIYAGVCVEDFRFYYIYVHICHIFEFDCIKRKSNLWKRARFSSHGVVLTRV